MATTNDTRGRAGAPGDTQVDYYKLLNVPYTATFQEITRAYREAMKRAHPDSQRPERRAAAEELAKQLNVAFATLSKAETRRAYDQTIKAAAVQDQIMSRYFGGQPPGQTADPLGEALRRQKTADERREQRRADRSAVISVLAVFGAVAFIVITLLVLWAAVSALFGLVG